MALHASLASIVLPHWSGPVEIEQFEFEKKFDESAEASTFQLNFALFALVEQNTADISLENWDWYSMTR